ncbi:N-fatty-acyl-amino acid synthase/hydrolase PM20D1 isoform X2 [Xenopus laevis]|uniref:N-fatty-acyl-amino acid synthase/hydrolase PM20D1 isoform X2 n=1 Tax=Xenopus laevis TaxID=8355 RepID=A0A8J0UEN0_XENLA|nr:N-fatty-acyl-amino acid synthase/hydrolase PM20D1 isoform X2 [Xenopus laevis]
MAVSRWKAVGSTLLAMFLVGLVALLAVLFIRTYTWPNEVGRWNSNETVIIELTEKERKQLVEALKGAIRIPTVSFSEEEQNTTALREFGEYIQKVFPQVFSSVLIHHEVLGGYSHLFKVQGTDLSLLPYMLLAHIDVVPAPPESWEVPPFSGEERDGYVYGRGTLDDKNSVIGILQALEFLLKRGHKPQRSFYIGLGHDEEVSGHKGALKIVEKLQSQGVQLAFVLDEGLAVLDGVIQGIRQPVALIGTTEKGSITLDLTVNRSPGHSSMPPSETSIGILAAAVSRLEQNAMPNMFGEGPEQDMFERLSTKFDFPLNIIMANLWLFSPILSRILERSPSTNAIVRTTTALTIFKSGIKVLDIMQNTIKDERVEISVLNSFDPLPVSPNDMSLGYQILQHTIHNVFSRAPVAPGVCVGNTDSRHFVNLTNNIYRFSPVVLKKEDVDRIHGLNERISKDAFELLVQFYIQLIQNADTDKILPPHLNTHEL